MDEPSLQRARVGDVELAFFEWGPAFRGRTATLLLAHATGFHGRCWDAVVRRLGDRHVVAVDQRGHGRSEKRVIEHWEVFGHDLVVLVEQLDLRDVVGVGHSMGGHAMVLAAAALPERFRRLVLIDPVIMSPDAYAGGWEIRLPPGEVHPTAKRKRRFDSPEAMIERFRDRAPFARFDPEALRDYCTHGLLPARDGGFELACPPEIEASVYMTSRTNVAVHDAIAALDLPVLVLRAKEPPPERELMDFASSPTWPELAKAFRRGREIHFPEHSHFLPMEIPERIAAILLEELGADA